MVTWRKESEELVPALRPVTPNSQDAAMSDSSDTEEPTYHPNPPGSSSYIETADERPPCGCALVQAIHEQLHTGSYPTTNGQYLEAIFTHREAFFAFPQGHRTCAIGFSDLAMDLERRDMRADRDGDGEAAAAFRHEAWMIASSRGVW